VAKLVRDLAGEQTDRPRSLFSRIFG
jgi:hypothetical protein